ncbi:MAG: hypothetical protein DRP55_05145, partial [Spirochaetes bacterium]
VKHFLLQITEFILIEINDLNIQGKTIVSLYGHGTLLTNKKPSDIDYELRLAVNSPYWSLGRFHLEAFIFGYNKFFTFEQVTGNGEITLGLADWATEFGLPQFMIVGVNGDFDWGHLIFYPDLLVAMGLLNESWRGVPIDSQHGSINGHIDLYIDFPNLIYGAVGNLTFKIVAYETTFIDILKYSIKGSYVSFINLEFHEGQGSISWHIPALYVFDYEENPKNTFEVRGSGTLNPKIGVCRVVNSKYNIDFTVSNLTLHIPYFLIELDAEKDITPETYLFIDTNNQYCEVNFEIADLIKVFGVNFRTEDLRIDFDVDGDYEGFVRITNQNAEITGLSIEIFNHWKIFATGGWGNYAELTWNTDGNGVGTITLDTNNEPFNFDFLIMRILQIKGGFTAEDLVCDFDLNADGVGYIEVNDGTAVLDEFTWFLFIKWTISGSLPKHGRLEWDIDGDFNGHIFIDTDNENLEWSVYIYDRILCSGSFKAQDKLIEWDWTGDSIIPFHRSGTISFNQGEFEAAVCIQGDWYNILGGFGDRPVADAGGPYSVDLYGTVTFDASGSYTPDPDDEIVEMKWNWWGPPNLEWTDWMPFDPHPQHTYNIAGEYTVQLKVKDNHGRVSDIATASLVVGANTVKIEGYVKDAQTNKGIGGAEVHALGTQHYAQTNWNGYYWIQLKAGRTYTLEVNAEGYQSQTKSTKIPSDQTDPIRLDFDLTKAPSLIVEVTWAGKDQGKKLFENEQFTVHVMEGNTNSAVQGATVYYRAYDDSGKKIHEEQKVTNSNGDASFTAIDVPYSDKDGQIQCEAYATANGYSPGDKYFIVWDTTATITGYVKDASTKNGIGGATVETDNGEYSTTTRQYPLKPVGLYELKLDPGTYRLTVSAPDYQSKTTSSFTVEAGEHYLLDDIYLQSNKGYITGTVYDQNGNKLYRAEVTLDGIKTVSVDQHAQYLFENVASGSHTLVASCDCYNSQTKTTSVSAGQTKTVDFNLEEAGQWIHPTTHNDPDSDWKNEQYAYDSSITTSADSNKNWFGAKWTGYLELSAGTIKCNRIKFTAYEGYNIVDKVKIDVYYNGGWHNIYNAGFVQSNMPPIYINPNDRTQIFTITKARISFYVHSGAGNYAELFDFQFYKFN